MSTLEAVKQRIYELCAERKITINKLSSESGLSRSSLKNILYGKSKYPGIVTIKILCDGLGITLSHFFSTDDFNNLSQEIK
ncbi:MAG: helix-turn-helix domain-containing protein [Clostridia bacterium]|nr:helix-turn-helix domain-containing protein [Clostridia bacterium]